MVVIGGRECPSAASRTVKIWKWLRASRFGEDHHLQSTSGINGLLKTFQVLLREGFLERYPPGWWSWKILDKDKVNEVNIQVKLLMIEMCKSSIETGVRTIFLSQHLQGKWWSSLHILRSKLLTNLVSLHSGRRTYSQGFRSNHGSFSGSSRYLELHLTDGVDVEFFSLRDGRWNS